MKPQIERSNAIIVTWPVQFLIDLGTSIANKNIVKTKEDYGISGINYTKKGLISLGYKECLRQIYTFDKDPEMIWWHGMGSKPVNSDNILYCYINVLSKIRFRFKVIGFHPGGEMEFNDLRKQSFKHWLMLHQPTRIKEIKMGGFQGFRYWKDNYQ